MILLAFLLFFFVPLALLYAAVSLHDGWKNRKKPPVRQRYQPSMALENLCWIVPGLFIAIIILLH